MVEIAVQQASVQPHGGLARRNVGLDLLRAIALLLVIGRHLVPHLNLGADTHSLWHRALYLWHDIGWLGVDLFFVLSGYLISGLLFTELRNTGNFVLPRFLLRRGLKIYPAYYVFLAYGTYRAGSKLYAETSSISDTVSTLAGYWPCLFLIQNYIGSNPWGHTWSLAVEEHFYLFFAIAFTWLISVRSWQRTFIIGSILALLGCLSFRLIALSTNVSAGEIYVQSHYRLDSLLIGVLLQYGLSIGGLTQSLNRIPKWVLAVGGLFPWFAAAFVPWDNPFTLGIGLTIFPISAACVVFLVSKHPFYSNRLLVSVLAWAGRNSYSSYLWHVTVIGWCSWIVKRANSAYGIDVPVLVTILFTTICSLTVGALVTRVVEVPVLRLRDKWLPSRAAVR